MADILKFPKNHPVNMIEAQSFTAHKYLLECKDTLEYADYLDVLCGIMDREFYDILDKDLRDIVDTYYNFIEN